jgi:hypothetical protein
MATFTLKLDDDTLRQLTEAARKAGVTPERMAEVILEQWRLADAFPEPDRAPAGVGEPAGVWADERRENPAGHDQITTAEDYEGPFMDLDEALEGFSTELNRRLKSPTG